MLVSRGSILIFLFGLVACGETRPAPEDGGAERQSGDVFPDENGDLGSSPADPGATPVSPQDPDVAPGSPLDPGLPPDSPPEPELVPPAEIRVERIEQLDSPWGLDFLPDGRALLTEQGGSVRVLGTDNSLSPPVEGLPNIREDSQGGLLDVLVGPTFAEDGYVYFCYTGRGEGGSGTEVARARFDGVRIEDWLVLFAATKTRESSIHYGCRLVFHADGHLFVGLGERSLRREAQNLENHFGTIVRIHPDGRIPSDNPFVNQANAMAEIWSYGHRNIQGMAVHPTTGEIWNHEHGPRGGDEVNIPKEGENYGWPLACYGRHYNNADIPDDHAAQGFKEPIYYWNPSIAPSGMMFYRGDMFPEWRGDLFIGALAGKHVSHLTLDGEKIIKETKMFEDMDERFRELSEAPDGSIYMLTDSGVIYRLYR